MRKGAILETKDDKKQFVDDAITLSNAEIGDKWKMKSATVSRYKFRLSKEITAEIKRRKNEKEDADKIKVFETDSRLNPLFWRGYRQANMDESSGKEAGEGDISRSLIYWSGYRQRVLDRANKEEVKDGNTRRREED